MYTSCMSFCLTIMELINCYCFKLRFYHVVLKVSFLTGDDIGNEQRVFGIFTQQKLAVAVCVSHTMKANFLCPYQPWR